VIEACDKCLARVWLLARLAPHLEVVRAQIDEVLALPDRELVAGVGGAEAGRVAAELEQFDAEDARKRCASAGVGAICRCHPRYPSRLHSLSSPPRVLHVAGDPQRFLDLAADDPVAIVGARRASEYGIEVARGLARALSVAGVTTVSGMALGVDAAAHAGALEADGRTIAVLPGAVDRPYPASKRTLYRRITQQGVAASELPPGTAVWRWTFPARNRIIAALSALTVVVEATERSGALLTAATADALGRRVGAVPGRVTSPMSAGTNGLLARGALVVRGAQDVLDELFGAGARTSQSDSRPPLSPKLQALLNTLGEESDSAAAIRAAGLRTDEGLAALAELELSGYVRRAPGGRYVVVPP
jgi:DNA processing protein